jgi:penicillin-binding protein 2A
MAQPGSTIKPLAVYTPALEDGYTFNSELVDEPTSFGEYNPENFSKTYQGKVPMYKALEESLNVPAVWLLNEIGLEKGLDKLKAFGIPVEKEDKHLAIALGGMSNGISPLQLANAFSAFPNGGKRQDSHLITKIVGPTGNIIAEREPETTKVTSKENADKMTAMLLNVVETGTGKNARIPDVQIAGKTGSTQLPFNDINGTKDQWMVGYTPNLVAAIWIGYDQTDRQHYLPSSGSGNVVPIFKEIIKSSIPHLQSETFDVVSINDQLAGKTQTREEIKEQAEKIKKELNQNAQKLGETIQEQAPVWKKGFEDAMISIGKGIDTVIQKLQGLKE